MILNFSVLYYFISNLFSLQILPPLADLLSYLPAVNPNVMNPLLKFIYSVILYMDHSPQGTQVHVYSWSVLFCFILILGNYTQDMQKILTRTTIFPVKCVIQCFLRNLFSPPRYVELVRNCTNQRYDLNVFAFERKIFLSGINSCGDQFVT